MALVPSDFQSHNGYRRQVLPHRTDFSRFRRKLFYLLHVPQYQIFPDTRLVGVSVFSVLRL